MNIQIEATYWMEKLALPSWERSVDSEPLRAAAFFGDLISGGSGNELVDFARERSGQPLPEWD